jgi:hypothetical protein
MRAVALCVLSTVLAVTLKPKPTLLHLKTGLDPHCSKGLVNTEMTVCCQGDCGECSDHSDLCLPNSTSGRTTTCCPAVILAAEPPSCDNSMAPCAISEDVRNPADHVMPAVHAANDCGEAKKDMKDLIDINVHYLNFVDKKMSPGSTSDCGSYGTIAQAAAACSNKDDCVGFTFKSDKPDCLIIAGDELETLQDEVGTEVYVKKEDGYTGHAYQLLPGPVSEACSVSCGGGFLHVTPGCKSASGVQVKTGMCSAAVMMNADALPKTEFPCNEFECVAMEPTPEQVCGNLGYVRGIGNYYYAPWAHYYWASAELTGSSSFVYVMNGWFPLRGNYSAEHNVAINSYYGFEWKATINVECGDTLKAFTKQTTVAGNKPWAENYAYYDGEAKNVEVKIEAPCAC